MMGVVVTGKYTQIRKRNGDKMVTIIKNIMDRWKTGRFMDLICRPYSINTYALSKIWYKTGCINIRECNVNLITTSVKSWLYQPMLAKPSECILYRMSAEGGLGLHHVACRAKVALTKTFIETALGAFSTNYYITTMSWVMDLCLQETPVTLGRFSIIILS